MGGKAWGGGPGRRARGVEMGGGGGGGHHKPVWEEKSALVLKNLTTEAWGGWAREAGKAGEMGGH